MPSLYNKTNLELSVFNVSNLSAPILIWINFKQLSQTALVKGKYELSSYLTAKFTSKYSFPIIFYASMACDTDYHSHLLEIPLSFGFQDTMHSWFSSLGYSFWVTFATSCSSPWFLNIGSASMLNFYTSHISSNFIALNTIYMLMSHKFITLPQTSPLNFFN